MQKSVLITGASHGIGKALAEKFSQEGYKLYLNGAHDASALCDVCNTLHATPLLYDISDPKQVEEMFFLIDRIDVLINNAGVSYIGLMQDMSYEDYARVMNTNLGGVFSCCQKAIPKMLSQGSGRIVNVTSVWGEVGASCEAVYSASKGGVNALTKALAKELAPSNIPVNAVSLGVIDTRMNHCFSKEEREALKEEIPAGRFASAKSAAEMIYSVATANSYLTGQIIRFDGGWI
ncbi:elongation factor P 5-aminopentanone reductase [Eubacterium oxidoreducens]|uniref:3-oxoacyl-[acyl-carrier protein] reductase n=1 Tax=Eubacterium oxidoreducens TaxID=1732 RepID=A0A1G6CL65_EUBOX|nr:SDR family NAD(P)-dependent oxidoreductase [Eubacterium oxidoreducens]SDB33634.1 3-oxoacyl-[acyl-carrier protein] reductase [Eubacterium oxidoreducens]